ncbi:hypothetical protein BO78DRAFT_415219 [Aspergillus sclerotiicarbonarius CBS 121057]|uniref:Uncharacterized protein n=1 Tax=Aspergillus sclerotiicarbonarius (strain CBS 121057 / IBT 28362) TaxID=1448318 RepID=A0A319EQV5_ASPSB|nr:hypothetical protein BO78DRAFT_415219 [Aspergillus sclerotiicarbonarius CBS 121057]
MRRLNHNNISEIPWTCSSVALQPKPWELKHSHYEPRRPITTGLRPARLQKKSTAMVPVLQQPVSSSLTVSSSLSSGLLITPLSDNPRARNSQMGHASPQYISSHYERYEPSAEDAYEAQIDPSPFTGHSRDNTYSKYGCAAW